MKFSPVLQGVAACLFLMLPSAMPAQEYPSAPRASLDTADNAGLPAAAPSLTPVDAPQPVPNPIRLDGPSGAVRSATSVASQGAVPPVPDWQQEFDRWVKLDNFTYAARYRSTFDSEGAHSFSQGQQRLIAHGKFKFDKAGRYGIGFHLSSGRYFNWAYADFIGGGQHQFLQNVEAKMSPYQLYIINVAPPPDGFFRSGGGQLYFRQFFLTAEPIRGIDFQVGGLAINHGVNSEATSYDDDGYIVGERLTVRRPKELWLSEVSYTRAYLGDLYTPNFFVRGQRLSRTNYWQFLGQKDFGKKVSISADYSFTTPVSDLPSYYSLKTSREGILADVHESRVLDRVRFEAYQRINGGELAPGTRFPDGKGYALTLSRSFQKRFSFDAGIANVDWGYYTTLGLNLQAIILGLTVNGDQYGLGKRYFVRPEIPLTSYLSLTGSYSDVYNDSTERANSIDIWNSRNLTAGLVFDVKKMIFGGRIL